MRKTAVTVLACLSIVGCNNEPKVTSTSYRRTDGTVAFVIGRSTYGFDLRALDSSGRPSLTLMKVNQCKSARLLWDGVDSVIFVHEGAEITYFADGFSTKTGLAIGICRRGSAGCDDHPESRKRESIAVSCG